MNAVKMVAGTYYISELTGDKYPGTISGIRTEVIDGDSNVLTETEYSQTGSGWVAQILVPNNEGFYVFKTSYDIDVGSGAQFAREEMVVRSVKAETD